MTKRRSLLHVRGGVSATIRYLYGFLSSSPRPWRCFHHATTRNSSNTVFSTSVEVFLKATKRVWIVSSLLHVRGGVSLPDMDARFLEGSSPRPWRCFWAICVTLGIPIVFSTSVEVFPSSSRHGQRVSRLLHVRGGVSCFAGLEKDLAVSSPRPWRCFQLVSTTPVYNAVFSTSVEVFLSPIWTPDS